MGFSLHCWYPGCFIAVHASHPVDNDWNNYRTVLGFANLNKCSDAGIFILRVVFMFFSLIKRGTSGKQ